MKGDFSRVRFNKTKHYTSVLQQQGRVALDADANEQCAINEYIRDTEVRDIIGPYGGPEGEAGFGITINDNTIQIDKGRYYVQGLLCENEAQLSYAHQPYLISPTFTDDQLLSELENGAISAIQVFLEVWQRLVTPLDDPCLMEPALGRADTTARLQTVWRVVAQPVASTSKPTPPPLPPRINLPPELASIVATRLHSTTTVSMATSMDKLASTSRTSSLSIEQEDCCAEMYREPTRLLTGKLSAQTSGDSSDCSCQPTPAAGYRGLENQLYRVEIHRGGNEKTATFKWSRENGSVMVAITEISGSEVMVDSLGFDANLGFTTNEWVEISDDTYLFSTLPNQPGDLYQIKSITPAHLSLTMTTQVSQVDPTRHARMRRWDQFGVSAGAHGIPLSTEAWFELENGIQIRFAEGNYQSGDYWLIPARTASGEIDWPPCDNDGSAWQPPHRVELFRAPLACIHWNSNEQQYNVQECRKFFPPLTEAATGAVVPALHVNKINWNNDDVMTFDQLLASGLAVTLDQAATGYIDSATFTVTLEVPVPSQIEISAVRDRLVPIVLRTAMPLDGQISVQSTNILWNLPYRSPNGEIPRIQLIALEEINTLLLLPGALYSSFTRTRVRLLGSDIFAENSQNKLFLDGQAFGTTAVRSDGVTPRIDLALPSGNSQKSSDFESWFYLAPTLILVGLAIDPNAVKFTSSEPPPQPTATLSFNYAPITDTVVTLSVITPANVKQVVSVPPNVTVLKNNTTTTFSVSVGNTGIDQTQDFEIIASLSDALGLTSTVSATLSVTGFQIIT